MSYSELLLGAIALFSVAVILVVLERLWSRRAALQEPDPARAAGAQSASLREELSAVKKEFSRQREIAERMPSIAQKITEAMPEASCPSVFVRAAKTLFDATHVGFFSPAEGSAAYTLEVGAGYPPAWQGRIQVDADEGLLGTAIQKKVVACRIDPDAASGFRSSSRSLEKMDIPPDFAAPVFGLSGIRGVLVVAGCPYPLEEERRYVSMLADLFSIAIQKASLVDATRSGGWKDDLTGLSTRLHFMQRFETELRRSGNYRQSLALLMFDVDKFKSVNDTYGHATGDTVIRKVAELTRQHTRCTDLVGRYGGDEFLVLITSSTPESALVYAENVRAKIAAAEVRVQGHENPIRLTISAGLAYYPTHGLTTSELMHACDHAMYEAKRKGRNQVCVADVRGLADAIDGIDGETPAG